MPVDVRVRLLFLGSFSEERRVAFQPRREGGDHSFDGGAGRLRFGFVRILDEVESLVTFIGDSVQEFVAGACQRSQMAVPASTFFGPGRFADDRFGFVVVRVEQVNARQFMSFQADHRQDGRADRDRCGNEPGDPAGFESRRGNDQRYVQNFAVQRRQMKAASVLEKLFAVVRGEDHDRPVRQAETVEMVEPFSDVAVATADRTVVFGQEWFDAFRAFAVPAANAPERMTRRAVGSVR